MYVGKKLRRLRLKLDETQAAMAESLALSQSYYSAVEAGKRKITTKMLEKIKSRWGIGVGYFEAKSDTEAENFLRGISVGVDVGVNENQSAFSVGDKEQESRRFKPYLFYNQLTDKDLEFEISLEIEDFKDAYNDYKKLCEALHELNAPEFLIEKFPIPVSFAEMKQKADDEFNEEHKKLKDARKRNLLILVDLYQEETEHWRMAISKLISYLHQYSHLILMKIQEDVSNGVSILNKNQVLREKRKTKG